MVTQIWKLRLYLGTQPYRIPEQLNVEIIDVAHQGQAEQVLR